MIDEKQIAKLQNLENSILRNTIQTLQDISVFQDPNGDYQLFNRYTVRKSKDGVEVFGPSIVDVLTFNSLKTAVAWCTNDKRVKVSDAKRILELDRCLCGVDADIQQHQKLAKKAKDIDAKLIYLAKLGEDKLKKRLMTAEMDAYVSESRSWQHRRFNAKP